MRWHHSQVSNGLLEGLNSLVQAAKRRARGYRSTRNYKTMIYLVAGKLNAGPAVTCHPLRTWMSHCHDVDVARHGVIAEWVSIQN